MSPPRLAVQGAVIRIETDCLLAEVHTEGYVSGVSRGTFVDKQTGARDQSFGLNIADFLLEPGWDDEWTDAEAVHHRYSRDASVHGNLPKRYVELPQICTQAKKLEFRVIEGEDFVAVEQWYEYKTATAGRQPGSRWQQTLVFPQGKRYFLACDRITSANTVDELIFRQDVPGHLRHERGDTFAQIYLSYHQGGEPLPASEFFEDFPPDGKFLYQRREGQIPERMIRAQQYRVDGRPGPWLAGMTLDPSIVYEAWCHQRGYICFIQEIGGCRVEAGEDLSAAYVIGWFDSIEEMHAVYDQHRGATGLDVDGGRYHLL